MLARLVERVVAFALQLAQALIVGILTAPFRALRRSVEGSGEDPPVPEDPARLPGGEGEE